LIYNYLQVLRHDKAILHPIHQKDHLKHVPQYLIPHSMRSIVRPNTGRKGKKRRVQGNGEGQVSRKIQQSKMKDPLIGGAASLTADTESVANVGGIDIEANPGSGSGSAKEFAPGVSSYRAAKTPTIAGRQQWKARHQKGKFDLKKTNKESHRMTGAFVKSKQYK
jgi:hypothetical protein